MISVYQLAERLGMAVTDSGASMAAIHGPGNTVVIYSDPGGQAYVNGRAMAASGGITPIDGILFVPVDVETSIRSALNPSSAIPAPTHLPAPAPQYRPQPPRHPAYGKGGLVVIDPGHGGQDPGTRSVRGDKEKMINLDVSLAIAERLAQSGVDVRLTRENDTFIELNDRSAIANRSKAGCFVSIHSDSSPNRSASGFTCYVSRSASRSSQVLADAIARGVSAAGVEYRGRKEANYRVLVGANCPAVLVELGFLSNGRDAAALANESYRNRLASAIADGIADYLQSN
jgi:N-acetylmuramoyl-L-alanine amidase